MPYESIGDLPKAQVQKYTAHQKKAFLKAFNNACKEYDGEEQSFCGRSPCGSTGQ